MTASTSAFPVALAPLAGVTDRAFREICKSFGADILFTEMVSAKGLYYHDRKSAELLRFSEAERPIGIQLFGSDPEIMAISAKEVEKLNPSFIDINMGCPVPKIVSNGEGSALMKNPVLVGKIVESVVKSVSVPVSVKIRAGFDDEHKNAPEIAHIAEESGAFRITVHGRTREQFYSGKSDRDIIRRVCETVSVPVLGNGDIFTPEDAVSIVRETGCHGVAVARGALGNPFIFKQIKALMQGGEIPVYSDKEKLTVALEQIRLMCLYKPEHIAVPEARKHLAWYLKGMKNCAETKNRVFSAGTYSDLCAIVSDYLTERGERDG